MVFRGTITIEWNGQEATIENDGSSMVLGQLTIGNDGFSMVGHHCSNDGMVTYHRWSLIRWQCLALQWRWRKRRRNKRRGRWPEFHIRTSWSGSSHRLLKPCASRTLCDIKPNSPQLDPQLTPIRWWSKSTEWGQGIFTWEECLCLRLYCPRPNQ